MKDQKTEEVTSAEVLLSPDEYHPIMEENRLLEKKAGYF